MVISREFILCISYMYSAINYSTDMLSSFNFPEKVFKQLVLTKKVKVKCDYKLPPRYMGQKFTAYYKFSCLFLLK